jgi:hypothetical protein
MYAREAVQTKEYFMHNLAEISHIVVSGFSTGALLYLLDSSLQFIVITKRAHFFLRC